MKYVRAALDQVLCCYETHLISLEAAGDGGMRALECLPFANELEIQVWIALDTVAARVTRESYLEHTSSLALAALPSAGRTQDAMLIMDPLTETGL